MRAVVVAVLGASVVLAGCGPSDNEGGCKDKLAPGDLVITEVFADYAAPAGGTAADEGKEWFEIFNASDRPVELEGLVIAHGRVEGTDAPKLHTMAPITIAPGTYLTLGNSVRDLLPAYIDYGYSNELDNFYNTDGGKLDLMCGSTVIDSANYDGVKPGRSRQLTAAQPPDYTLNDDQVNWCEAGLTEFETNNFGTPGEDNDCQPVVIGQCSDIDGMREAVKPAPGQIVITEFHANPGGTGTDDTQEWFEVTNTGSTPFDLNGLGAKGNATTINVVNSPECKTVAPGDFAVFARRESSAENGGLPGVDATFTFALAQTNGSIHILDGETPLDSITWASGITDGTAKQLDPDLFDTSSNDTPGNFCNAVSTYGTNAPMDRGTPGAPNTQCMMLPPAGMCDDNGTLRAIVKPGQDQLQITEFLANPATGATGSDSTREWFEIVNVGTTAFDLNELTVADTTDTSTINSPTCITVGPNAFALLARSGDSTLNGMLPPPDATFSFSLVDTDKVEIRDGATVLDVVDWASVTSGIARQLDPDSFTAANNDAGTAASTQPWCPATMQYGDNTNTGTPRAANHQCP